MNRFEMIKRINTFRTQKKDWDSYGADPINKATIELALSMVDKLDLSENWFVAPCSGGEIMFESEYGSILNVWREDNE